MGYMIKASYKTGDSFHNYDTSDEFAPIWKDLSQAKKALRWLSEHHAAYEQESDDRRHRNEPKIPRMLGKPWFITRQEGYGYQDFWHSAAKVELDDGTLFQVGVPYHGYFERLHSLEIICEEDPETYVRFD